MEVDLKTTSSRISGTFARTGLIGGAAEADGLSAKRTTASHYALDPESWVDEYGDALYRGELHPGK
jgi:hypothetical protein